MPHKRVLQRSSLASFETLVRKVKETFLLGRKRVKEEMIRTYLQTGKYIHEHLLSHQDRADYGKQVVSKLAKRVEVSERTLHQVLQVYRSFPKIPHRGAELSWRVLRTLATIPDASLRQEFVTRAVEGKWTEERLRTKIKEELRPDPDSENGKAKSKGQAPDYSLIARPKLGTLYTYRLVRSAASGELQIDQGFRVYRTERKFRFKEGDIVKWNVGARSPRPGGETPPLQKIPNATAADLFTYKALVERVVDGDTLLVEIDLGFTNVTRQYLRLRALDTPEIDTVRGRKAKDFVVSLLKAAPFIFLTSTRSDKWVRYLADVFIPGKVFLKAWEKGTAVLSQSEDLLYLNNELLAKKLAHRVDY